MVSAISSISAVSSNLGVSSAPSHSLSPSSSSHHTNNFVDRALAFIASKEDDKFVKWLRKHSDEPFSAATRWVVERFQFGICMFDPAGLKSRYSRLVDWEADGGLWTNYWTTTVPRIQHDHHTHEAHPQEVSDAAQSSIEHLDNDEALLANGILSSHDINPLQHNPPDPVNPRSKEKPASGTSSSSDLKNAQTVIKEEEKQAKQEEKSAKESEKKSKPMRHFVILPNGLGSMLGGMDKWENVPIAGVEDEVNAHTGLFIPKHNLSYEGLVERVANRVLGWCDRIVPQVEARR